MSWFFFALIGPFLYALTNQIDKVLLEKYFKEGGVGTLLLVSSLLAGVALPFLFWADPTALSLKPVNMLVMVGVGISNFLVLFFYLLALKTEEASIVIVFYQLVPVFGLVLGYFLLGESISSMQFAAMMIIIFGATLISLEFDSDHGVSIRRRTIYLMSAASFFWALGSVLFKLVAIEERVWRTLFWEHLVLALIGVILFICVKRYRDNFLVALRVNSSPILALNFTNETLYMLGNLVFGFAYMMAPISLVLLADSFQPIFVLLIGILLTVYFPRVLVEKIERNHIAHKLIAISITVVGAYVLLISS